MKKTALIAGASGLVGSYLIKFLIESGAYESVTVLTRRELNLNTKELRQVVLDFDELDENLSLGHFDDVFCCLGTTIKKAGSQEVFRKVDHDYVLKIAKLGINNGASKFLFVSSIGADSNSKVFYSRVKGEVEEGLKSLNYQTLHLFRPSMLGGKRNEFRLGEKIASWLMKIFSFVFIGKLKRYKIIAAEDVATSMFRKAQVNDKGVYVHESETLHVGR